MSENTATNPAGEMSSEATPTAAKDLPEPPGIWIKIEKLEPVEEENQETEQAKPAFEPEVKLEVPVLNVKAENLNEISQDDPQPENGSPENLTCTQCGRKFNRGSSLALHIRSHDPMAREREVHECQKCHSTFPYKYALVRHKSAGPCSERGVISCSTCRKEFKNKLLLRSHMTSHNTERPYECERCGKRFKHSRYLSSHMTSHDTARPYSCNHCRQRFKHSSSAAMHRRRHTAPPPKQFPCSVCDKRFSILNALECHMRIHTQERPFQCAICTRAFSHKHNMMRHMQRHSKVVRLKCEICHKEFPRESRLKYHMRVHYTDKKPYKCGECHKTYSHVQNITRHYRKKHPDHEYIPPTTDAEYANRAWERLVALGEIGDRDTLTGYILPECNEPNPPHSPPEQTNADVIVQPELVILDNPFIKQEVKQEVC